MSAAIGVRAEMHVQPRDAVLLFAVAIAGAVAAVLADARLWYVTPVVAVALLVASRDRRTFGRGAGALPEHLDQLLAETFVVLPAGRARELFGNVVRAAMPVFARRTSSHVDQYDGDTRSSVCELLASAAQVALDLSRLDAALDSGALMQRDVTVREAAAKARDRYAAQLTDATSTLSAAVASGLAHGTPESDRVAALVAELRDGTKARGAAWKEIDALLGQE